MSLSLSGLYLKLRKNRYKVAVNNLIHGSCILYVDSVPGCAAFLAVLTLSQLFT